MNVAGAFALLIIIALLMPMHRPHLLNCVANKRDLQHTAANRRWGELWEYSDTLLVLLAALIAICVVTG
jgi:hypothetical protein